MNKAVLRDIEVISRGETTLWHKGGVLHRDNGPAIEKSDGTQFYYRHGQLHRDDGPAIIRPDGTNLWFNKGTLHRNDGPPIVHADGSEEWLCSRLEKKHQPKPENDEIDFDAALETIATHGFS